MNRDPKSFVDLLQKLSQPTAGFLSLKSTTNGSETYHNRAWNRLIQFKRVLGSSWEPTVVQIPIKYSSPTVINFAILKCIESKVVDNRSRYESWSERYRF